jgi:hypothetical protein
MNHRRSLIAAIGAFVLLLGAGHPTASGPLGIYGIIEKVVLEPDGAPPERIQLWGAFAYVEGGSGQSLTVSPAVRGYLYFRLGHEFPVAGSLQTSAFKLQSCFRANSGSGGIV